jgi:hypothetical protein
VALQGAHVVGAQQVANAAPDGHTLMLAEAGTFVLNPNLYPKDKQPIDIEKDFIVITGLVRIHHSVMVAPNFPVNSVAELIALAKQKPGEITYGTAGIGSGPHVNVARFENEAKVKLNPIHYRGATPAQNDVMGGHTNMMMVSVSLALPAHRDGKVKLLSIGSPKRLPQLPEFPTTADRQPAGLYRRHLVRACGHRRNAAPDRGQDQRRRACAPGRARVQGAVPRTAILRDDGQLAGRVPKLYPRRDANLGPDHPRAEPRHRHPVNKAG